MREMRGAHRSCTRALDLCQILLQLACCAIILRRGQHISGFALCIGGGWGEVCMRARLYLSLALGIVCVAALASDHRDDQDEKTIQAISTSAPPYLSPASGPALISETFLYIQAQPDSDGFRSILKLTVSIFNRAGARYGCLRQRFQQPAQSQRTITRAATNTTAGPRP